MMQVDITTYIFKELEYTRISKNDIRKQNEKKTTPSTIDPKIGIVLNTTGLIGINVIKEEFSERTLLLFASDNQKLIKAANLIAQGEVQIYKGLNYCKVQTYKNGS